MGVIQPLVFFYLFNIVDNLFDNSRGMPFALARFPIKIKKHNSIPNYSQHH